MNDRTESGAAKLRVFVRSRKVPVGLTEFYRPTASGSWILSQSPTSGVVYEDVLDDSQKQLVAEARRLSCGAGLGLEVIDLSKMGVLRRAVWSRFVGSGLTWSSSGPSPFSRSGRPSRALS